MAHKTPLYDFHRQAGAQLVDFAGWDMPLHYGSQIQEHHAVRKTVGLFDVSHMGVIDITGQQAPALLRYALANDVQKLKSIGQALYTCMLNEHGGVIDDLIVYRTADTSYRLVVNASRREADLAWIQHLAQSFTVNINPRWDMAMLALQGPQALAVVAKVFPEKIAQAVSALKPFTAVLQSDLLIGRTGYTGEDGVEIIVPAAEAVKLWQQFLALQVTPCGLGARDTLRLEAGLNLYGTDMDENTSPLVSNLAWTISWQDESRDFVGKKVLQQQRTQGVSQQIVGLVMEQAGVLRNHQKVFFTGNGEGEITSGSFSPTLGHAIALARIPKEVHGQAMIERRGQHIPVKIVKPPFVRLGQKVFS